MLTAMCVFITLNTVLLCSPSQAVSCFSSCQSLSVVHRSVSSGVCVRSSLRPVCGKTWLGLTTTRPERWPRSSTRTARYSREKEKERKSDREVHALGNARSRMSLSESDCTSLFTSLPVSAFDNKYPCCFSVCYPPPPHHHTHTHTHTLTHTLTHTHMHSLSHTHNTQAMRDAIGSKIGNLIFGISTFLAGLVMSLIKGWQMALIGLCVVPVLLGVAAFMFGGETR